MSVRGTNELSWKIIKKVALGKNEQIFSRTVSVAASEFTLKNHFTRTSYGNLRNCKILTTISLEFQDKFLIESVYFK